MLPERLVPPKRRRHPVLDDEVLLQLQRFKFLICVFFSFDFIRLTS